MGRAPLDIGKPGNITIRELKPKVFQARCRFRDLDGVTRLVAAQGKSRTGAQNALLTKLANRPGGGTGVEELKPHHRFTDAATLWLTQIQQTQRGTTHQAYRQWLTSRVLPDIGEMRIRELRVGYLDAYFTRLRIRGYAPNTLRMIRKVIRGPMALAVQHEAVTANPIAGITKIKGQPKQARALTAEERRRLRDWLHSSSNDPAEREAQETARRRDVPDVVQTMLGTGLRVGELMGLRWSDLNLDGAPMIINGELTLVPTVTVRGNVTRVRGQGLVFHEGKTASSKRTVPLPPFAAETLRARRARLAELPEHAPVFCVMTRGGPTWRDPSKVTAWVREIRGWVGLEWMTTHVWRKTAATILDEAGLSARDIANQMGHAQISMTQNVYLGRGGVAPAAAAALEAAWQDS